MRRFDITHSPTEKRFLIKMQKNIKRNLLVSRPENKLNKSREQKSSKNIVLHILTLKISATLLFDNNSNVELISSCYVL
jgi:hypothetical protein